MNLFYQKKTILFSFLFFIIMGGYALLRELRDSLFIHLVGLSFLPKAKLFSLIFLFFELLFYQKLIDAVTPRKTFLFFTGMYSIVLLLFGFIFFYSPSIIPSFLGYLFYIVLEGYPPFVWSLLWAIFTTENSENTIKNNYMLASLFAQVGGFVFSFLFYYLIKKNIFDSINSLFGSIMVVSGFLLVISILLMSYLKNEFKSISNPVEDQNKYQHASVVSMWYYSFKKIIGSWYVFGIFLIIFCWEVVNITLNYFRLDVLLEKTTSKSFFLLQDLYYSISLTYFLGIFIVLIGTSFLVRLYGVRKTLIAFPILLCVCILPLLIFDQKDFLVFMYMVIKAFYPALIFPIKESLYLITSDEIRYKSKSWIDGLGSRFSKTFAAFYIQISLFLLAENRYILHVVFFSLLLIVFLCITNYVGKVWEEKVKKNEIIS